MELSRNLRVDCVNRLTITPAHTLESERPVREAVELMRREKVGNLLICRGGMLSGIFTERDLLAKVLANQLPFSVPLAEVMTANPVTVQNQDPIRLAIKKMQGGGYRQLPVVNGDGKPLGVLNAKAIIHYLAEHYPATVYTQPPQPNSSPDAAEGA